MTEEQLLHEIDGLIRNRPSFSVIGESEHDDVLSWLGRVAAVTNIWDESTVNSVKRDLDIRQLNSVSSSDPEKNSVFSRVSKYRQERTREAYRSLVSLLYQARYDLLIKLGGQNSVSVPGGRPYDYFEEIRKKIELAHIELFFVDRYIDAEFVSIYLPQVRSDVSVRLLTLKKMEQRLVPALNLLTEQYPLNVEVRYASHEQIHDRYMFIDKRECYQSGSSFKDGSRKYQTTLNRLTDAYEETHRLHEQIWSESN